jgi:hypothetical protein
MWSAREFWSNGAASSVRDVESERRDARAGLRDFRRKVGAERTDRGVVWDEVS